MRTFQYLLFVLEQSYICYYIICMTVPLTSRFFVNITVRMEVAINIKLLQSSIIITYCNHVAHKHSKKVKGVLPV